MDTHTVKEIQQYLRTLSFNDPRIPPLTVDGIYGATTSDAVRSFQYVMGLPITGNVDSDTWEMLVDEAASFTAAISPLYLLSHPTAVISQNSPINTIMILQAILRSIADDYTNIKAPNVSGVYDEDTTQAVKQLQRLLNLTETGNVDRQTWNVITALFHAHQQRPSNNEE